ncbi:MAG: metallophosphoesterase, partial [Microvirga sp.]
RPASHFAPVPGSGIPLMRNRRWLGVIGAVGQPRDGDPAACYALLHGERSMRSTRCRVTFCGHVHVPALFFLAAGRGAAHFMPVAGAGIPLIPHRRWLAVIGAVGQPRDGEPAACYALLHHEQSALTYVRVPYDIDTAAQKILDAGLPERLAARLYRGV